MNTCPACGFPTLEYRTAWESCIICDWEDDGQDEDDADEVYGGPNQDWSLRDYRGEAENQLAAIRRNKNRIAAILVELEIYIESNDQANSSRIEALVKSLVGPYR